MKFSKILLLICLVFLLSGIVCAGENSTKITFEGVNFNIPDSFNQSGDVSDYDKLGSEGVRCLYQNGESESIEIIVVHDWMGMSLDDLHVDGAVKGVINSHEGWKYSQNGLYYFSYVDDDSGIIVGSQNQTLISEIIV